MRAEGEEERGGEEEEGSEEGRGEKGKEGEERKRGVIAWSQRPASTCAITCGQSHIPQTRLTIALCQKEVEMDSLAELSANTARPQTEMIRQAQAITTTNFIMAYKGGSSTRIR